MAATPRLKSRIAASLLAAVLAVGGATVFPDAASADGCGTSRSDVLKDKQWELQRMKPETAWPLSKGRGQLVAVIDSGVSDDHPLLAGQLKGGKDYIGNDPTCDNATHGTLVAGIIAAKATDGGLFYGVAPEAKILPIRVIDDSSKAKSDEGVPDRIAQAIRYAVREGATVINMSLRTVDTPELKSAVEFAVQHNVVLVAAAGNLSEDQLAAGDPVYPAKYDGVLAVGGIDQNGAHVATSNPADFVDLSAPGVMITGPAPQGGGFGRNDTGGTSFASPFVAGTAALVRAYYPDLSAAEVAERLIATADAPPGGWSKEFGYGVVNPYQAVASLNGKKAAEPAAMSTQTIGQPHGAIDPLAGLKAAAGLSAAGAVSLSIIILVALGVRRHVRGRGRTTGAAKTAQP